MSKLFYLLLFMLFLTISSCRKCEKCYLTEYDDNGKEVAVYDEGKKCGKKIEEFEEKEYTSIEGSFEPKCE